MFHCFLCHNPTFNKGSICSPCLKELPWNQAPCPYCGEPRESHADCLACTQSPPVLDRCLCPLIYKFPVDQVILRGKGGNRPELLKLLSHWLADNVRNQRGHLPALLLPVPLLAENQQQRGYNQAGLIAHALGKQLGIAVNHKLLKKVRATPQQKELDRAQRQRNLTRAYRINRDELNRLLPQTQHVAIIDDVITTGSTLNQLAHQLKRAGINRVEGWALARSIMGP